MIVGNGIRDKSGQYIFNFEIPQFDIHGAPFSSID